MHILLIFYKLLTWTTGMFSAGLTWSARLPIFVCIGDNKGKDYASLRRETRARKRRPLFLYCEDEFTVWRPFRPHIKAGRCLGLVLKFTDDYVDLLGCYSESACLLHPGNFPPRAVDRFSHNSVNIHWPSLWKIYRYMLALTKHA